MPKSNVPKSNIPKSNVKHVHRVSKKLSNGDSKEYHYAFRGGPQFWNTDSEIEKHDPLYYAALTDAIRGVSPGEVLKTSGSTGHYLNQFRKSAQYKKLAPRTRSDYEKYISSFEEEFGEDPIRMFEEDAVLEEIH